ncbi:LLM class oxidoreductase [Verrucomicrobiales bacterium BCK34]|nr:LLM class oxidoreductase [Verrucomicrobiales bacterium BCK34]
MNNETEQLATGFEPINRGYDRTFQQGKMTLGLVVPLETYDRNPVPTMERHLERVQLAEQLGFSAVWLRDVPFNVPGFGDAGQLFDPFVYLGYLAGQTETIALGVASIVLPLRHPAHVAKAAASADVLSGGRLLLGIASGDRPQEYPALDLPFENRGERFRASYEYLRQMENSFPVHNDAHYGILEGTVDLLPKPAAGKLPLLITGGSQQDPEWIARNGDGWMLYPRDLPLQNQIITQWRGRIEAAGLADKPVMQPLHIDLAEDPETRPSPIHLGYHLGIRRLKDHLKALRSIGVNHLALNLRFNQLDIETTMKRIADELLSEFS